MLSTKFGRSLGLFSCRVGAFGLAKAASTSAYERQFSFLVPRLKYALGK